MPNNDYANEPNQSRSEEIIQATIDGTEYDEPARSRIEYLLKQLKDLISTLRKAVVLRGETTTPITDNATTNPIMIDGQSYTAIMNDAVIYQSGEFIFDGTKWHALGDLSNLTDYIDINESPFVISGVITGSIRSTNNRAVCFYDSDKNFISSVIYSPNVMTSPALISDIPQNAKYVRFAFDKAFENGIMLNTGSTALPYEPYWN